MSGPLEDVYEAAARAYDCAVAASMGVEPSVLGQGGLRAWAEHPAFRAAVEAVWPAGVAAGRAQAAADLRALHGLHWQFPFPADLRHPPYWSNQSGPYSEGYFEWCARIAEGGEARG